MNAPERLDWTDANQRVVSAELARLKRRLEHRSSDEAADDATHDADRESEAARAALGRPSTLDVVARAFGLDAFERDVLLLAAGVELDGRIAQLCGEAAGHPQRPWATFGLALATLADPHWSALAPTGPLRRWGLVRPDDHPSLTAARLVIDERVLHFIAGVDTLDARLATMLRTAGDASWIAASHRAIASRLADALQTRPTETPVLHGDDRPGREDVASACAAALGWRLCALDPGPLVAGAVEPQALRTMLEIEASLGGAAFFVDFGRDDLPACWRALIERLAMPVFVGADRAIVLDRPTRLVHVPRPSSAEQRGLWREHLAPSTRVDDDELDAVVSQFDWSARRIAAVAASCDVDTDGGTGALWSTCVERSPARLTGLATRVATDAARDTIDALVVPAAQREALDEIERHVRHRHRVEQRWGFDTPGSRGRGIAALFTGPSGTGKTLAAEVLAARLGLELHRIDLAAVVSKYIGETEKNLARVFDAADEGATVLLFDEADALFGKRSEVKDSHDRYANIEVGYLLQRIEASRGLAILTTNHRSALDPAFVRRLRFIVHFAFPETVEREEIWRRTLSSGAHDDDLAWGKLARLQASGGEIRNIARAAAFLAVREDAPVAMRHLLKAAHANAAKLERPLVDSETRGWA